jgi:O-antigen ligase
MSAAMAARHILLAYGLKFTIRLICIVSVAIPLGIWVFSYFPEFYRLNVGQSRDYNRATGTFGNPNEAGVAACMVAAAFYSFMIIERSKIMSIAGLALCAFAVLLTASRAAFMIFAFLTIAQIVISPGFKKVILSLVGGAAIAGILFAVYNVATSHDGTDAGFARRMDALLRVARGEITDETTGGRFELAKNGIREWSNSILLGNGLGTQSRVGAANIGPHNTYIRIGGEAGVIPLAVFLALVASLFWQGWNCHVPAVRTLVMGYAIVFAVTCLASHGVLTSREQNVVLGTCFGLLAACLELRTAAAASRRTLVRPGMPPARRAAVVPS